MCIFDIETGPLPERVVLQQFDPASVNVNGLVDQKKIDAKIEKARQAILDKAALSAMTGQVLVVGCLDAGGAIYPNTDSPEIDEAYALELFWNTYEHHHSNAIPMVGFNSNGFDVPFLLRRSWILGVDVPDTVFQGRYLDPIFVDLMDIWRCGNRQEYEKIGNVARMMGVGAKTEGINGGDFAGLWNGTEAEHAKAIEYSQNDLTITAAVADRMGVAY